MAKVDEGAPIAGKKLVPRLAVGCLLFAAIMGFGTFMIGQWMSPYLKKRNDEYLQQRQQQRDSSPVPSPSGLN